MQMMRNQVDAQVNGVVDDDPEWPINRWLRLQAEEEADTRGRLTSPRNEVRKRQPQEKASRKNKTVDHLREKQLEYVNEQIYLQKVLQENAAIAQDEARARLDLAKFQQQNAETMATIAEEKARERVKLLKTQVEIAEITLRQRQGE